MSQVEFRLNCLVLGNTRDHIFSVKIASSENGYALKEAIKDKNKHAFKSVDAHDLILYSVSLTNNCELEKKLKELDFSQPIQPTSILAKVFPNHFEEEHLHVIVQPLPEGISLWH